MRSGYLLIDGNSLGHYVNNSKKLSIGSLQVQAIYGFLRSLHTYLATYPQLQPVVLWDGASWRKAKLATYKDNRDREITKAEIALAEQKRIYKAQAPYIEGSLRLLGVPQVRAFNMEADDLAAIVADRYVAQGHKVLLLSGDKDWIQLVNGSITWRDIFKKEKRDLMITPSNLESNFGVKTTKQFIEMKALAGDAGDDIPGVGGIGEKGAVEFLQKYGSVADFLNMALLEKTIDIKKLPKKFRALIEDESKSIAFTRNLELVDLRTSARPTPINFKVDKGAPNLETFRAFCDTLLFRSITADLEHWVSVFPAFKEQSLAA